MHEHAHLIFVYACASHFGMRMSISFVCTCASHLRVRMLITIRYAHAHLILSMRMRNSFLYRSVFAVTASTKLCQVFSNVHYSKVWKAKVDAITIDAERKYVSKPNVLAMQSKTKKFALL